jgi:hypothetical protein
MHPGRERAGLLPNRGLTLDEMKERIRKGIDVSLMRDEPARDTHLEWLKKNRPPVIWAPAKKNATSDKRIRVSDERRFLAEIERLGVEVPEYRLVSADEIPFDEDAGEVPVEEDEV